jgi:HPt (histidine-containing phosphotransfer) domain-containing protein
MSPLFDRESLLDRIGGDASVLAELIELFLDLQPQRMNKLAQLIAAADYPAAAREAHALAGALHSMSMRAPGDLAKALEQTAAQHDPERCRSLFLALDGTCAQVMAELDPDRCGAAAPSAAHNAA